MTWPGALRLLAAPCVLFLLACAALPPARPGAPGEPPATAGAPSRAVAFAGVDVLPMTAAGGVLRDQTVVVEGDRIVARGPRREVTVPAGALRVAGEGRYLMPGLADMHVHLEYFEDPAILGLFLANGVTTVRNMDGRPYILEWKRKVAAGELLGPSIHTAGPLLDGDPPILPDNTVVRDAAEARVAVLAQRAAGYDFVKVYTNLSPEAYREVLAAARELGLPVAGHVPRRVDLREVLAGGQVAVEHLADYGRASEADDSPHRGRWHWSKLYVAMPVAPEKVREVATQVAAAGVWTVPTMVQAERALAPPETVRAWSAAPEVAFVPGARAIWEERLQRVTRRMDAEDWSLVEQGRANRRLLVAALHEAGARLLVGTDTPNPFVVPGFSAHEELANLVSAGLRPAEALAAATREAARFLGELDEWGTVEVGKRADLVLLESNPLQDVIGARRPAGVMVRGRWLPADELEGLLARAARDAGGREDQRQPSGGD